MKGGAQNWYSWLVLPAFMASRLAWLVVVSPSPKCPSVRLISMLACWVEGHLYTRVPLVLERGRWVGSFERRPQCVAQFCGLVCLIREAHEALT